MPDDKDRWDVGNVSPDADDEEQSSGRWDIAPDEGTSDRAQASNVVAEANPDAEGEDLLDRIRAGLASLKNRIFEEEETEKAQDEALKGPPGGLDLAATEQAFAGAGAPIGTAISEDPSGAREEMNLVTGIPEGVERVAATILPGLQTPEQAAAGPPALVEDPRRIPTPEELQQNLITQTDAAPPIPEKGKALAALVEVQTNPQVTASIGSPDSDAMHETMVQGFEFELNESRRVNREFREQFAPKRTLQIARAGLRDAPGALGLVGRAFVDDNTLERMIDDGIIELTTGEKGLKLAATFAPPVVEVMLLKPLARAASVSLPGKAGKLAAIVGRKAAGSRLGGAATGVGEGIHIDALDYLENASFTTLGAGVGIGAVMGLLLPGKRLANEVLDELRRNPEETVEALADFAVAAKVEGQDLPSQLDIALARAMDAGDTEGARLIDDAMDRLPTAMEAAERRAAAISRGVDPDQRVIQEVVEPEPTEVLRRGQGDVAEGDLPSAAQAGERRAREAFEPEVPVEEGARPRAAADEDKIAPVSEPQARRVSPEGQVGAPGDLRTFEADEAGVVRAVDEGVTPTSDVVEGQRATVEVFRGGKTGEGRVFYGSSEEGVRGYDVEGQGITRSEVELENPMVVDGDDFGNIAIAGEAETAARGALAKRAENAGYDSVIIRGSSAVEGGDEIIVLAKQADELPLVEGTEQFARTGDTESVTNAAIRNEDGQVYEGGTHGGAMNAMDDLGVGFDEGAVMGFTTTRGRFVTRQEAKELATEGGQVPRTNRRELDAADLGRREGDPPVAAIRPGDSDNLDDLFVRPRDEFEVGPGGTQPKRAVQQELFADLPADHPRSEAAVTLSKMADNPQAGFVSPEMMRLMGFPVAGGALGGLTTLNPADRSERFMMGAGLGMALAIGPAAAKTLAPKSFRAMMNRQFKGGGQLIGQVDNMDKAITQDVNAALSRGRGQISEADRIIQTSMGDIASGARAAGIKGVPTRATVVLANANPFDAMDEPLIKAINDFMTGSPEALGRIPAQLHEPLSRMRKAINTYSEAFMKEGIVEGELKVAFDKRLGSYITRSYQVFDDPNWAKNAPKKMGEQKWEQVKADFKGWVRRELDPDGFMPEDKVDNIMRDFLEVGPHGNPLKALKAGNLGAVDTRVLAKRNEGLASEVRNLWGEHTDPKIQFARTITNQAGYIANYRFLRELKDMGLGGDFGGKGRLFWDEATGGTRPEGMNVKIGSRPGHETLGALEGLYTSEEMAKAMTEQFSTHHIKNPFIRHILAAGSMSKIAKTVGSMTTQVRNLVGNTGFAITNGFFFDPGIVAKEGFEGLSIKKGQRSPGKAISAVLEGGGWKADTGYREWFDRMGRLGIVDDAARAGELKAALEMVQSKSLGEWADRPFIPGAARSVVKTTANALQTGAHGALKLYQMEDDVWKVLAFGVERQRYAKALPGKTTAELDQLAADVVRDTWPSFSQVPEFVQQARRIGGFLSFPAEVYRTINGTMRVIERELKDPALRHLGARRVAGAMLAATGASGAALASRKLMGVSKAQDEAVREDQPPWSENSNLVHLQPVVDGKYRVWDFSYTDPYSYLQKPLQAFMRGEDWRESSNAIVKELLEPWFSTNPMFSEIAGGLIKSDDEAEALDTLLPGVLGALEPAVVEQFKRAISGQTSSLRDVGRGSEIAALVTGQKAPLKDSRVGLGISARAFTGRLRDTRRELEKALDNDGQVTRFGEQESEFEAVIQKGAEEELEVWMDMTNQIDARRIMGLTDREIHAIIRDHGISKTNAGRLMSGMFSRKYLNSVR